MSVELATSATPARKQQQRSLVTQQKLLDAAIEAFSQKGYKGTSTRDIADRAGVHHPLITYHFKNKDQLWRAAADKLFKDFWRSMLHTFEEHQGQDPKLRMKTMIRSYIYYAKNHPALHKVMVQESNYPNDRLDWLIEEHLSPFFDVAFGVMKELQSLGIAPAGNPALLFNMIRLCTGGMLALSNELKGSSNIDFEDDATLDELADMIVRVMLPGNVAAKTPAAVA